MFVAILFKRSELIRACSLSIDTRDINLDLYISNYALFFVLATFIFYCCIIPVSKHNDLSSFYSIICFKIISLVILHFNNCMWYSFKFFFYLLNLYYNFLFLQICLPFYFQNLSALCKLKIRKITMSENIKNKRKHFSPREKGIS